MIHRLGRLAVIPIMLVVLAIMSACAPQPAPPSTPPAVTPVDGRVAVTGDSIYVQAAVYGSEGTAAQGYDTTSKIGLGWRAVHAQPRLTQDTRSSRAAPDVVVIEFGHNYSGGWTRDFENQMLQLTFTPHPTACRVMVLPHYAGTNPTHRAAIEGYRNWVDRVVPHLQNVVVIDWRPIAQAHPEYMDSDGVHLLTPQTTPAQDLTAAANGQVNPTSPSAARAFIDMVMGGVARCPR